MARHVLPDLLKRVGSGCQRDAQRRCLCVLPVERLLHLINVLSSLRRLLLGQIALGGHCLEAPPAQHASDTSSTQQPRPRW
ncbi:hypothetical protein V6R97_08770 [Chromohalobacter salexigens]|uniref:hypothetical protein n=1 Tax=Chromohalobacter israelensis TaxID=141390 RepID=UPI0032E8A570